MTLSLTTSLAGEFKLFMQSCYTKGRQFLYHEFSRNLLKPTFSRKKLNLSAPERGICRSMLSVFTAKTFGVYFSPGGNLGPSSKLMNPMEFYQKAGLSEKKLAWFDSG